MSEPRGKRIQRYSPSPAPASVPAELRAWLEREFRALSAVQTNAEWDGVANTPAEYPPIPHEHDWDDIYNEPLQYPPIPHTHVEADITDLDRIRWMGLWEPGAYVKNDLVRDEKWLALALTNTTDKPIVTADPVWFIDPEPVWGGSNSAAVFGVRVTGVAQSATISAVRIKAKQAGPFDLWMVIDGVRIDLVVGLALVADVWCEFHFAPLSAPEGSTFDIVASGGSYNENVGYFAGSANMQGFIGASYPPAPGDLNNNAYGVDAYFYQSVISPDWEVL